MKISIVTWDCNFRENLHTIDSFCNQDYPKDEFEFIWVDFYSSNDHVREEIKKYSNAKLLTLNNPRDTKWHLGKCLNAGVEKCSGEILIIPDGDILVEPNLLKFIETQLNKNPKIVLYLQRYDEPKETSSKSSFSIEHLKKYSELSAPMNYGGCMSTFKKNFGLVKGYETHCAFTGPGASGRELYTRFHNAGLTISWAEEKFVYHPWHHSSGSTKHNLKETLTSARKNHPWILPHAGLEQSWIIQQRSLLKEKTTSEDNCNKYLSNIPKLKLSYYKLLSSFDSCLKNLSELLKIT